MEHHGAWRYKKSLYSYYKKKVTVETANHVGGGGGEGGGGGISRVFHSL